MSCYSSVNTQYWFSAFIIKANNNQSDNQLLQQLRVACLDRGG